MTNSQLLNHCRWATNVFGNHKRRAMSALLVVTSLYCFWAAGWIHLKAWLAQELIAHAWRQTLVATPVPNRASSPTSAAHQFPRPWPWADTQPVAQLTLPDGKQWIVLQGAQGNSLAFGPGLVEGSDLPGQGFSVIGGHRDTHFASLADVAAGQIIKLESLAGTTEFSIQFAGVVDVQQQPLIKEANTALVLVTCYPFDTLQSDPNKRWVVKATAKTTLASMAHATKAPTQAAVTTYHF